MDRDSLLSLTVNYEPEDGTSLLKVRGHPPDDGDSDRQRSS